MDARKPEPSDQAALARDHDPFQFQSGELPGGFARLVLTLGPGERRGFCAPEWRDAIAFVERGLLELDDDRGRRWRFGPGSTLALDGVLVRGLHNPGTEPTVIVLVKRSRPATADPAGEADP